MIVPGKRVLVEILPNEQKPGMVMGNKAEFPYRGKVLETGSAVTIDLEKGMIVYFRYHFGYIVPGTSPELMVIEFDNIELIERKTVLAPGETITGPWIDTERGE